MTNNAEQAVELNNVVKRYGSLTALHRTDLDVEEGAFLTLLGPSGCGKTTTLRMIAGLTSITEGEIRIKGKRINDVPIYRRNLGIVFQNYALFPHKTIYENVAFGLKHRRVPSEEVKARVTEALELVQLPHTAERMPNQLSGGQQQRIALARAIVIRPDVLLLDEPLSALDANLREDMRVELKRIQHALGVTTVFVTHDQSEALAMSDKIVVMSAGRIEQQGTPEEVYNWPASEFVAGFLGNANILQGRLQSPANGQAKLEVEGLGLLPATLNEKQPQRHREGDLAKLSIRAEKLLLNPTGEPAPGTARLQGCVTTVDYQGQLVRYFLDVGGQKLQAVNTIGDRIIQEGEEVTLYVRAKDCVVLPEGLAAGS